MTPDVRSIVERAVAAAVTAALEANAPPPAPPAAPAGLPAWCSVVRYAAHVDLSPRTVRSYAALAAALQRSNPALDLVAKYGRDWRIHTTAFDAWVRADGPRRAAEALAEQEHVH